MKCGDVIIVEDESFVIIATRPNGGGFAVPVSGNVMRFSWAFCKADAIVKFNILDRMPEEASFEQRLVLKEKTE